MKPAVRSVEKAQYRIDPAQLKRFDQRKTVFGRMLLDDRVPYYRHSMYREIPVILKKSSKRISRIDVERVLASWTVYDYFHEAFAHDKLRDANNIMDVPQLGTYAVEDPGAMGALLKETACLFGAEQAGICRIDERWVYSHDMDGKPVLIPEHYTSALVMTVKMNPDLIATSPGPTASIETGQGYSRMAYCIACVAEFIRRLGYRALPMGNDTALSIPLAIDAGLGELGRHGLLITPEHGPCVRLCKVFTDLPVEPDQPITFGIREYCSQCTRCAEACKPEAISNAPEASFTVRCPSNNNGIERWAVNHDRCYEFWIENGSDCSSCIAACPFTRVSHNRSSFS